MSSPAAKLAIATIPNQSVRDTLHRFANAPDMARFLAGFGISPAEVTSALNFFRRLRLSSSTRDLISGPFSRRGTSTNVTGRFSAEDFPVFYSALDEPTAAAEIQHYMSHPDPPTAGQYHKEYFTCAFVGAVRDLRPHVAAWPDLVGPTPASYPACVQLARDAVASGTEAFYTLSVRRSGGTCTPVFENERLDVASVVIHRVMVFEYDATGTLVASYQAP